MEKDKKTGAIRKEDGAKAPDSTAAATPEAETAPVVDEKAEAETAPVVDEKAEAAKKVAADKSKKAANDKASKIKREKAEAAKKVAKAEAAKRHGFYIKPGLAITSNKGIVAGAPKGGEVWEGDKVTDKHFTEEVGARLYASGAIVEVK